MSELPPPPHPPSPLIANYNNVVPSSDAARDPNGEAIGCFCGRKRGEWTKLFRKKKKRRSQRQRQQLQQQQEEERVQQQMQYIRQSQRDRPRPGPKKGGVNGGRRDAAASLSASIGETYQSLLDENPDMMDEKALRRAMELSMLDFAIVKHSSVKRRGKSTEPSPHEILRVREDASQNEIKSSYRQRALETHPDRGGRPGEFEAVARAYRALLNSANKNGFDASFHRESVSLKGLKSTAHWDSELKEHRSLVRELYQNHGMDIDHNLHRQSVALKRLGLRYKDAGATNRNEKNQLIRNSCFYLSLAASYLSGIGALAAWDKSSEGMERDANNKLLQEADRALICDTALQLKRVVEAAVLSAHPEWAAKGMVGEEVQAFSDFLVYILESQTIISEWAVVVFDTSSGFVDIYEGQGYKGEGEGVDKTCAASNTLVLRYVPGHYQPLMVASPDSSGPTLKQIISVLDECRVLYVVTDGSTPE